MAGTYEPIILRVEDLPDDAVVIVRAGVLGSETVRRTADDSKVDYGFYGVSVEAALDTDWEELCRTSSRIAGIYKKVRLSTAGRIRGAGFPLLPTQDRPHYDIVLADLTERTVDRLIAAFDEPVVNPGKDVKLGNEEYPQ